MKGFANQSNNIELDQLFNETDTPNVDNADEELETPIFTVDLDMVNSKSKKQAEMITERLANYFFDQKYLDNHPYIPTKIAQEVDNIRRLIKMLCINERAQDTIIQAISLNASKGNLYSSLTSLQNSMLSMQTQLNSIVSGLENIFKEMQDNAEETFEDKEKEVNDNGEMVVRGSREFIKEIEAQLNGETIDKSKDNTMAPDLVMPDNIEVG